MAQRAKTRQRSAETSSTKIDVTALEKTRDRTLGIGALARDPSSTSSPKKLDSLRSESSPAGPFA
jgi:hypothetical protein